MAFMGRGDMPDFGLGKDENNANVVASTRTYLVTIQDKTLYTIDICVTIAIIIMFLLIYIFAYKTSIPDFIESTKNMYINSLLVSILVSLGLIGGVSFLIKEKNNLIKFLSTILIISSVVFIIFVGIRLNMDNKYTESEFSKIYDEEYKETYDNPNKVNINVGLEGVGIQNVKETFVEENVKAYNRFKMQTLIELMIYLLIIGLNLFIIMRIIINKSKIDEVTKADSVLFDDVQNVKY